jgi:uncharacterized protein (TIGR02246 family)
MESQSVIVRTIYDQLIDSWNSQDAEAYAQLFADDGHVVGFDGSEMQGRDDIRKQLEQIFRDHHVASYVTIVRSVKQWSPDIFMLTASVGMLPPGSSSVNPNVNAVQNVVVKFEQGQPKILLFQNTPAAYHGRSEKAEQLTRELNAAATEK